MADLTAPRKQISIWWFAFGYFAAYVPYSFMTKVLTDGLLVSPFPEMTKDSVSVNSFEILPPTIFASVVMMLIFISAMRWWKYATQWTLRLGGKEISLPRPRIWTLLSGICTGLVVMTTTLAYTIEGVSIVFAMLLMRGGLLIMSPIVDTLNKRHVRWFSWCALALSLASLFVAFLAKPAADGARFAFNMMLMVDVVVYLAAYFVRLSFMSKLAKSDNPDDTKKFFVEEQMIGTPSILIILFLVSLFYSGQDASTFIGGIYAGFHNFLQYPGIVVGLAMAIGFCSQFNGVFGGLVLLDKSENAFSVPVNRCSSILAGVMATLALAFFFDKPLSASEFVGAAFILCAILFLTIPPQISKRRAKRLAQRSEG
ncbi:MAG: hypothetical protein FWC40_04010 [Proteobacteria bacterium]|nr:hypothetical protein [Pseudomonadota bacterium]